VSCASPQRTGRESAVAAEFRFKAPQAKRVSVVGTFNRWDAGAHPLRGPDGDGVWSLRLSLPPGRYRYMFVVDGAGWVADPAALASEDDGFGRRNSLLIVGQ
jgi:1,4-alpha-glucan branching enzyme